MGEESQLYSQRATNNPPIINQQRSFCAITLFRDFDMSKLVFYVQLVNIFCNINDMDFLCRVKVEFSPARPSLHCLCCICAVNAILEKKNCNRLIRSTIYYYEKKNSVTFWAHIITKLELFIFKLCSIFRYIFESVFFQWVVICSIARTAWLAHNFLTTRLIFT